MKSLIIGMGIGTLYQSVLTTLGYTIVTVDIDPSKEADYTDVTKAIKDHHYFDTVHICTPNFTHKNYAEQIASVSKIVFVEKPGFKNSKEWSDIVSRFPDTRFMMIKNNMWRNNINELSRFVEEADIVNIEWIRQNCIPNPGNWFTNKELAYGGVSRDLMPHLLSLFIVLNSDWKKTVSTSITANQNWQIAEIESTEYGKVNPNGIYNVDDLCIINYGNKWHLEANWRSLLKESSAIEFIKDNTVIYRYELGWCPEEAYFNMINDAVINLENNDFWIAQYNQDIWIHQQIENI